MKIWFSETVFRGVGSIVTTKQHLRPVTITHGKGAPTTKGFAVDITVEDAKKMRKALTAFIRNNPPLTTTSEQEEGRG